MPQRVPKIGQLMSVGLARPSGALVKSAEIEVRIMQSRIQSECMAIGLDCFLVSTEVLEKTGQIKR